MSEHDSIVSFLHSASQIEAMERLLKALVAIPSGTREPAGLDRTEALVARAREGLGLEVRRGPGGVLLAGQDRVSAGPRVLLVGHLDTVYPPGDGFRGLTEARDAAGRRLLRGPGSADMKGGLTVLVGALRALRATGRLDPGAVTVLLNRDEEIGSPASAAAVTEVSRGHDLALVLEPGFDLPDGATSIVVERAGFARVRVEVTGAEAHAGNQPERGLSAVATAARMVALLDDLADPGRDLLVRVCTFAGGTSINQVPGTAVLGVDVRFREPGQWEAVREAIASIAAATVDRNPVTGVETRAEVEVQGVKPPMPRGPGVDRYLAVLLEAAAALGQRLAPGRRNGTSDGNFTAAAGTPTLDGLGAVGAGMHVSGEEAVRASSLPERAALLATLLARLGAGAGP